MSREDTSDKSIKRAAVRAGFAIANEIKVPLHQVTNASEQIVLKVIEVIAKVPGILSDLKKENSLDSASIGDDLLNQLIGDLRQP